eukprot:scaffold103792_cov51-Phaeocystis_antarctica.AAC.2
MREAAQGWPSPQPANPNPRPSPSPNPNQLTLTLTLTPTPTLTLTLTPTLTLAPSPTLTLTLTPTLTRWRVLGGAVRPAADGADLSRWLDTAPALLDALQAGNPNPNPNPNHNSYPNPNPNPNQAAARALRQRGACDDPRSPTVLRAPTGAAAQAGACAAPVSGLAPSLERLRREVTCPRKQPVLCGDGVCRHTFLDCAVPQLGMDLTRLLRLGCHSS